MILLGFFVSLSYSVCVCVCVLAFSSMADLKSTFLKVYSVLKDELLQDPAFEFTDASRQWIERMLDYNVPGGGK